MAEPATRVEAVFYIPEEATGRAMAIRGGLQLILGGLSLITDAITKPQTFGDWCTTHKAPAITDEICGDVYSSSAACRIIWRGW